MAVAPTPVNTVLSPATRARSVLAAATDVRVGVLQDTASVERHALDDDGSVLFRPVSPGRFDVLAGRLPASPVITLTAYDVAPVPLADRVRGHVTLHGTVSRAVEGRALRLVPTQVLVRWCCEPGEEGVTHLVPLDEYAAARPDPVAGTEARWLAHLHEGHAADLAVLAARAGADVDEGDRVFPLAIDRSGVVLRLQRTSC